MKRGKTKENHYIHVGKLEMDKRTRSHLDVHRKDRPHRWFMGCLKSDKNRSNGGAPSLSRPLGQPGQGPDRRDVGTGDPKRTPSSDLRAREIPTFGPTDGL